VEEEVVEEEEVSDNDRLRLRMRVKNLGIFEKSVKNSIMLVKCVYKSVFLGISPNFARI